MLLIIHVVGQTRELTFLRFETEEEFRKLAASGQLALVFLYVGNIVWILPAPQADTPKRWKDRIHYGIEVLGKLSADHHLPVIATQGTELRAEAGRAGITFLEAPFKAAELMSAVRTALGIAISVDRRET